jgi:hypothetical protein
VQKYEKGTNRIGSSKLVRIAETLDIPVMALFDGVDDPPGRSASSGLRLIADRRAFRLAQSFAGITDPLVRLSIIELVERTAATPTHRERRRK